eukprot:2698932-Rhodomonas_salina.3
MPVWNDPLPGCDPGVAAWCEASVWSWLVLPNHFMLVRPEAQFTPEFVFEFLELVLRLEFENEGSAPFRPTLAPVYPVFDGVDVLNWRLPEEGRAGSCGTEFEHNGWP